MAGRESQLTCALDSCMEYHCFRNVHKEAVVRHIAGGLLQYDAFPTSDNADMETHSYKIHKPTVLSCAPLQQCATSGGRCSQTARPGRFRHSWGDDRRITNFELLHMNVGCCLAREKRASSA